MLQAESIWQSPFCPHCRYGFVQHPRTRPRVRMGPFFQVILGLDASRVRRLTGELAKPFDNGPRVDLIQYYAGGREAQRVHWIQSIDAWPTRSIFRVFEFLVYLKRVYELRHEIPYPFEEDEDDAMDFTDKVYRTYLDLKQQATIPWIGAHRRYLMENWFDFRTIGIELAHRGITLKDIMNIYNRENGDIDINISPRL